MFRLSVKSPCHTVWITSVSAGVLALMGGTTIAAAAGEKTGWNKRERCDMRTLEKSVQARCADHRPPRQAIQAGRGSVAFGDAHSADAEGSG